MRWLIAAVLASALLWTGSCLQDMDPSPGEPDAGASLDAGVNVDAAGGNPDGAPAGDAAPPADADGDAGMDGGTDGGMDAGMDAGDGDGGLGPDSGVDDAGPTTQ